MRPSFSLLVATLLLASSCGHGGEASKVYADMQTRVDKHRDALSSMESLEPIREETRHYEHDMRKQVEQLSASCCERCGRSSGMIVGEDANVVRESGRKMLAEIEAHRSRVEQLVQVAAVRSECHAHYSAMGSILGEMRGAVGD
jgi:hypothetical protein